MPYPYDQVFAADPATPENVASNGVVTIFAPGDPDRTPLTITTLDGLPLSNPMQVNDAGFGPAFMHATLDQVAWSGGGYSGLFVSYKGMKDEAVAARVAAEEAVSEVQAPTDASVDRGIQRADIPGKVAQQIADGPIMAGVVAGYAKDPANALSKALRASLGTNTYMLTPERFPSINNLGTASTTAALQAAINSLPFGATAVLVGTYQIESIVLPPTKFLTIDASAATFIMDGPNSAFQCFGSFEPQIGVSAVTVATMTVENGSTELTKLATSTVTGWKRGDVIKVIADNRIPASHVTSDTAFPRVGEFATVYSSSGTTVYLQGILTEPFTSNIRAARMVPGSVTILHPTCDISDDRLSSKISGNMFRFDSLIDPQVIGARINRLAGMGLSFKSCYGYYVEDLVTYTGLDNTDIGVLSYSVHDSGCTDGVVRGGSLRGGRHGFTDGAADVAAGSPNTNDYGASINFLVEGVTVRDMTAACLDTHHNGRGGRFVNCTTHPQPGQNNYTLRGRDHRIINPTCYGGRNVVGLVGQVTGAWSRGETYGAELVNPRSFGTDRVVTAGLRSSTNHPFYGVRDKARNLVIQGGYHEGLKRVGVLINADVRWRGHAEFVLGSLAEGAFWELTNSALHINSAEVDASGITTISPYGVQRVLYGNDDEATERSDIQVGQMKLRSGAVYRAAATTPFEVLENAERVVLEDIVFDPSFGVTNPIRVAPGIAKQSIRWRVAPEGDAASEASSATAVFSNDALTGDLTRLFRSPDPVLQLSAGISDSTARTLAPLPRGKFVGQSLRIVLTTASAPLTIANGLASNAGLIGSASKVLAAANDQITVWWSGSIWRQGRDIV